MHTIIKAYKSLIKGLGRIANLIYGKQSKKEKRGIMSLKGVINEEEKILYHKERHKFEIDVE